MGENNETDCSFRDMFHVMYDFMKSGKYTDFTFVIGPAKIRAHKNVVAASSVVFDAMFTSGMREAATNDVILEDADAESFRNFLEFLYTEEVSDFEKHAETLLMYADKYNVPKLISYYKSEIESRLTVHNAANFLLIADFYEWNNLKKKISSFISENMIAVVKTEKWYEIAKKDNLYQEIVRCVSENTRELVDGCDKYDHHFMNHSWYLNGSDAVNDNPWRLSFFIKNQVKGESLKVGAELSVRRECLNSAYRYVVGAKFTEPPDLLFPLTIWCSIRRSKDSARLLHSCLVLSNLLAVKVNEYLRFFIFNATISEPFSVTIEVETAQPHLRYDFRQLTFDHNKFSDATIQVEGTKFPIHKAILASSSEFFSSLLTENQNEYIITEMRSSTYRVLKDYMYNNTLPPPEAIDLSLLIGARKFKLEYLVEICSEHIARHLTVNNVKDVYIQSDKLSLEGLKAATLKFMESNISEYAKTFKN